MKNLILHTDTLFDFFLNDGFFIGFLILLFSTLIYFLYKFFKNKKIN